MKFLPDKRDSFRLFESARFFKKEIEVSNKVYHNRIGFKYSITIWIELGLIYIRWMLLELFRNFTPQ